MTQFLQTIPGGIILLILGFVCLVKGADAFVEGSSSIAKIFKVPALIIGMTIVAMGTSLPETAVSVAASLKGNNTLAISNVVGSNTFNLMVVIGVCAFLTPVAVQTVTLKRDLPFSIVCALALAILAGVGGVLGHLDGVIFLVIFAFFLFMMMRAAKQNFDCHEDEAEIDELVLEAEQIKVISVPKSIVYIIIGGIGIALGGDWVVDGASAIATALGLSQTLIGLTIVAFGTSLPELVTSVTAAKKGEVDMALGNAIGSNVFNILMVLGVASAISPISFMMENVIDIVILTIFSLVVWIMAWTNKELSRREGAMMVILYAVYVVYICLR